MKWLNFKRVHPDAKLPVFATKGASGMDVCTVQEEYIYNDRVTIVSTGLQVEIPEGYELQVRPRSGLAQEGVTVVNAPGTIDSDYRGEIKIMLIKLTPGYKFIQKGDRVAQLVLAQIEGAGVVIIRDAANLTKTERGDGGFGSTGK